MFLGKFLFSEPMTETEPVRLLKSEACFPRVEAMVREPVKPCENPLTSRADEDSEPVRVLTRAEFSVMIADEPSEPVRSLVRPLICDVAMEREPDIALKIEACLIKLEEDPMVAVSSSACPFDRVSLMASEPVSCLLSPFASEMVSERDPARLLAMPLISEPVRDIDPENVLDSEECSANVAI